MTPAHPEIFAKRLIHLLGSAAAARDALDKQHKEISARWDQDAGLMGRILRAHLFVEHYLTEYLQRINPMLGSIKDARLSFAQKMELAERPNSAESYLFPGIRRLNTVRNRLAHTLQAEVTEEDRDVFLAIPLFRAIRDALAAPNAPSEDPVGVLEEFACHAGIFLKAASDPQRDLWTKAIYGSSDEASASAT